MSFDRYSLFSVFRQAGGSAPHGEVLSVQVSFLIYRQPKSSDFRLFYLQSQNFLFLLHSELFTLHFYEAFTFSSFSFCPTASDGGMPALFLQELLFRYVFPTPHKAIPFLLCWKKVLQALFSAAVVPPVHFPAEADLSAEETVSEEEMIPL